MMNKHTPDTDLNWPLAAFEQPKQAADFFSRFRGAFSVYSMAVRKIYTEYSIEVIPSGTEPLLVIQPNMYEFTSMFHNVDQKAVFRSSVVLYEDNGEQKLSGVMKGSESRRAFDLKEGLYRLFSGDFIDDAFLPLITYGDLRSLPDQTRPIMQLHGLKLTELEYLSEFQVKDIVDAVTQKIIGQLAEH